MARFRPLLLPLLVFLAGLGVTYLLWQHEKENARRDLQATFDFYLRDISSRIAQRMAAYEQILRGAQGFLESAPRADRRDFARYVDALQVDANYSGIQGIGLITLTPGAGQADLVARLRRDGVPDFAIRPAGDRPWLAPITQIEPLIGRNLSLLGFDPYSEPVRRQALERARDSGNAALSGKVRLVSEAPDDPQPGVLLYLPLYAPGQAHGTVAERRAALVGWVFAPFRMVDLMAGLYGEQPPGMALAISDGVDLAPAALLFASSGEDSVTAPPRYLAREYLSVAGHTWTLTVHAGNDFVQHFNRDRSDLIALAGLGLTLLLTLLCWQMLASRQWAMDMAANMTRELRTSEERWKFALEGSGDGLWDRDLRSDEVVYSPRCVEMLGHEPEEVGNRLDEWIRRIHPDDLSRAQATTQACIDGKTRTYSSEHRLRCKDGSWKWVLSRGMVVSRDEAGVPLRLIGTVSDISERKAAEERIHHLAQHDPLTDLPNRALFADRLQQALALAEREDRRLAVLYLDLDEFKPVNDSFGHGVGDELLKEVARRLQSCVRSSDTVGRIGGDEFVVLLPDLHGDGDAKQVAEKILAAINHPFLLTSHNLVISASIGISLFPDHGRDALELARNADQAMYRAKGDGRNCIRTTEKAAVAL